MAKIKKTAVKCCPLCQLKVGVASKTCPGCKHSYANAKQSQAQSAAEEALGARRRRTERVKRVKPDYYDASEYEKKTRKKTLVIGNKELRGRPLRNESLNKKKKKKTSKKEKEEVEAVEEEEEPPPVLTAEKARQCSIILAEINRKFMCTTWRV
ncbi:uncharacterized protein [Rhodnius prolixus]|uniref:Uncharacterized protein n=2 Tax=Rhodnius TaxID=13248 RepID=R4G4M4_RHOPR